MTQASGQLEPAIVVTGASSGIGREIAKIAAKEGSFLLLIGRSQQALEDLAAEIASLGGRAAALPLDLVERDSAERIEQALAERQLYCDVLVNSAGFGVFGPAAKVPRSEQLGLVDVNLRALTELTLRFLPGMVGRGRGGILNVGSITGYAPGPNMAVYYAGKAYVRSFSAALAAELAGTNVTVTCLAPGVVRTPFFDRCTVGESRIMKLMPRSSAIDTAEAGWRGFRAGKALVIPRLADRIIVGLLQVVPERLLSGFLAKLQRPRSRSAG